MDFAPGKEKFFLLVNKTYPLPTLYLDYELYPSLLNQSHFLTKSCHLIKLYVTFSSNTVLFIFYLELNFLKKHYLYSTFPHPMHFEPIPNRLLLSQYSLSKHSNALLVAKHISRFSILLIFSHFYFLYI